MLFQFIVLLIKLGRIFFCIYYHQLLDPNKNNYCKFQITAKKNFNSRHSINIFVDRQYFQYRLHNIVVTGASFFEQRFSIQITQFRGNVSKVVGQTSQVSHRLSSRGGMVILSVTFQ